MQNKKSDQANINKNRFSFLLLGLICSTSFTLMSFEYATFSSSNKLEAAVGDDTNIDTFVPPVLVKPVPPSTPKPKVQDPEFIEESPEPLPAPDPTPQPQPTPVNPYDGFDVPEIVEGTPVAKPMKIDSIFDFVEKMPEFPGGIEAMYSFLGDNLNYPAISLDNGSNGIAYVQFVVEPNGEITDMQITKGVDQYIDKEAVRVVGDMPKWTPGENMGRKVRVSFVLPINFKID